MLLPSRRCCCATRFCIAFITFCSISKIVPTLLECRLDAKKKKKSPFFWLIHGTEEALIHYLHKSHDTPLLPSKNLHRHYFRLLLVHFHVPCKRNCKQWLCKSFWGVMEVYYGIVQVVNWMETYVDGRCRARTSPFSFPSIFPNSRMFIKTRTLFFSSSILSAR